MKIKVGKILIGLFLIVFGVLLALNALEITNIDIFFKGWWTLFIIVPCFIGLFTDKNKIGNIIGILIGVLLMLAAREVITYKVFGILVVTLFVILIGFKFIFSSFKSKNSDKIRKEIKNNNQKPDDISAVFSAEKVNYSGIEFKGANFNAVFGGVECDLRNATINSDCVINANAIFGGIDIFAPDNINVKVNSTAIFGGVDNKKEDKCQNEGFTLYIEGVAIFGGVDIK